ncbi:hypothetical protein ABIB15_001487 [Marisediminicola sp. UYEF4]
MTYVIQSELEQRAHVSVREVILCGAAGPVNVHDAMRSKQSEGV